MPVDLLDQLGADIRHSLRVLRSAPLFSAIAVLSLALGIGANTAIFSIVNAVMLKTLPVADPERLVQIGLATNGPSPRRTFTNPIWEALRDHHADLFDGAFAFASNRFDENASGERRTVDGMWVSGGFFETLGVHPWLGRLLTPADDVRGGGPDGPVVVISYTFWRDRYGASPTVVGGKLSLGGQSFTIVGVTPPGFLGPNIGTAFNVAVPLGCEPLLSGKDSMLDVTDGWWLSVMARLKPQSTMAQTEAALRAIQPSVQHVAIWPNATAKERARFLEEPFTLMSAAGGTRSLRERYQLALFALLGIVGLVLLIACANLANLLLARATARQKEFAVRLALGASRPRLIRYLLVESLLIASTGAALGLLLARWASQVLVQQLTPTIPNATPVVLNLTLDWRVLGFTLAATIATALLFGLAPAFRSTDLSASALMKSGARSIASGWTRFSLEKLLIAAQVALSLVLVFGAALFVRSFTSLATLDPGFTSAHVLTVDVNIQRLDYPDARRHALFDQIREAMRATPGVQAIASHGIRMMQNGAWESSIHVDGYTASSKQDLYIHMNAVSPGYFSAMGTALSAGRDFTDHDTRQAPLVAIVNQAFARKYFPGKNAVGQRFFRTGNDRNGPNLEIVGIVRDTKYENLRDEMPTTAYVPLAQGRPGNGLNYVVRAVGDPDALRPALGHAIAGVSTDISYTMTALDATIDASLTQERMLAWLGGFFGMLTLLVSGIGLYGVMWLAMTRRRAEIGIRMALGAEPATVIRMVLRETTIVIAIGIIAGLAIAIAGGRLIATLLFGLSSTDVSTWVLAIALLAGVAILAGYLPARRASRIDPIVALREE